MAKKRKPIVKNKRKPTKRKPAKKKPAKKKPAKNKGMIGSAISKIPEDYKVKGGRSKITNKFGSVETSYDEVKVGKRKKK